MLAGDDSSHLRRHEELPQLCGLRSSLFLLGEKMIAQLFDDPSVTLPEPFRYFPISELGLLLVCKHLVLLALGAKSGLSDLRPNGA
jgi:hypothetical protein